MSADATNAVDLSHSQTGRAGELYGAVSRWHSCLRGSEADELPFDSRTSPPNDVQEAASELFLGMSAGGVVFEFEGEILFRGDDE